MDIDEKFKGYVKGQEEEIDKNYKAKPLPKELTPDEWIDKVNKMDGVKDNNIVVVKGTKHTFYKVMTFLFFLLILGGIGGVIYLGYNGHLNNLISTTVNPYFNSTTNVDAPITNNNNINPTIPIYNNITTYNYVTCPGNWTNSS